MTDEPETAPATARKRRIWLVIALLIFGIGSVSVRPVAHLIRAMWQDESDLAVEELAESETDDASRLNRTTVAEVWAVPQERAAAEQQIAELLQRAKRDNLRVAIAGARHSMGGHTIYPDGIVIDMLPFRSMELDKERKILTVGSGAIWGDIIEYLDPLGFSVEVMQSNNSFSVGGSVSVNCHGWQFARPPICCTVESLRLMNSDGEIVRCSRDENAELFSLVLGGYGLFGVILDVELRVIPNECYRLEQSVVPIDDALTTYFQAVEGRDDVRMVYGRLNIVPDELFEEAVINVFALAPDEKIPDLKEPELVKLRRAIFRGSVDSAYGKELRWAAETKLQPHVRGKLFSRNQLLNESVSVFQNRSSESTDILHEYFVPVDAASDFVIAMREIIHKHKGDLLNVTVREVKPDTDTFLKYADVEMFAFVMLFNQKRTDVGDNSMQAMTRSLIEASIKSGGRYYLPYRLHATVEQFQEAYPQGDRFFELKRQHDPDELFQNQFYVKYGHR